MPASAETTPSYHIPASRSRAAGRAALLAIAACIAALPVWLVAPALRFRPVAGAQRLFDYAFAWLLAGCASVALLLAWRAAKWFRLAIRPGPLGFVLDERRVVVRLGPYGGWECAWSGMSIIWPEYLLDLPIDRHGPLPLKECPPIYCGSCGRRLDADLRHFAACAESQWWPIVESLIRPKFPAQNPD